MITGYHSSGALLDLGKAKTRDFYQEQEIKKLAEEARNFQPRRATIALNRAASIFKLLGLTVGKNVWLGLSLGYQTLVIIRQQFSVRPAANQWLSDGRD